MALATLTSKGQLTIPMQIRVYLGLHVGDKLEFFIEEDGKVTIKPRTFDVKQLKGLLRKPNRKVSIEEMNQAIVKRGAEDK